MKNLINYCESCEVLVQKKLRHCNTDGSQSLAPHTYVLLRERIVSGRKENEKMKRVLALQRLAQIITKGLIN
jgi:hypothetical protein